MLSHGGSDVLSPQISIMILDCHYPIRNPILFRRLALGSVLTNPGLSEIHYGVGINHLWSDELFETQRLTISGEVVLGKHSFR